MTLTAKNLILGGFDCGNASVGTYGYNISVVVQKKPFNYRHHQHETSRLF